MDIYDEKVRRFTLNTTKEENGDYRLRIMLRDLFEI